MGLLANRSLRIKYFIIAVVLGILLSWISNTGDVVWWFWFVPLLPVVVIFIVDWNEYRCANCRRRWALVATGPLRLGEMFDYACQYCGHLLDPDEDYPPIRGRGEHTPARGVEKAFCYVAILAAVVSIFMGLFVSGASIMFVGVGVFMIVVAVARLKGWVKAGGPVGGGGP